MKHATSALFGLDEWTTEEALSILQNDENTHVHFQGFHVLACIDLFRYLSFGSESNKLESV